MGKPPEVPDVGPDREELIETVREATSDVEFGTEFLTDLLLFFRENARNLFSGQTTFFILGSYREYPIRRLHFAERELNSRTMTYAFVLCDLLDPNELPREGADATDSDEPDTTAPSGRDSGGDRDDERNGEGAKRASDRDPPLSHCKFYLLATYSDYLVPIFEGRHAGPSVELGELRNNFFDETHVFARDYAGLESGSLGPGNRIDPDVDTSSPYSQPQDDLFTIFDVDGRFYEWQRRTDLATEIQRLPED